MLVLLDSMLQSSESPIPDAHFCSENGVSCPYEQNKIGDLELWYAIFVNGLAQSGVGSLAQMSFPSEIRLGWLVLTFVFFVARFAR